MDVGKTPDGKHSKQQIFFHMRDWKGIGVVVVRRPVQYVRVPDSCSQGKWKAINISLLGLMGLTHRVTGSQAEETNRQYHRGD